MPSSAPKRRNNISSKPPTTSFSDSMADARATVRSSAHNALLNPPELLLFSIYPLTLLIGSLFSLLNPPTLASPYSRFTQSHAQEAALAPSYFARKSNIFNQYFVKIGWFWTTLAFLLFFFLHPLSGPTGSSFVLTRRRLQSLARYTVVTTWWLFVTQWFFGPALIDRSFRLTGGQCRLLQEVEEGTRNMSKTREFSTAAACKLAGGRWTGGHDVSGHVFILILGSAFLIMEIMPVLVAAWESASDPGPIEPEKEKEEDINLKRWGIGAGMAVLVAGASWWMLLMTAAYFHTWFEKVGTGPLQLPCQLRVFFDPYSCVNDLLTSPYSSQGFLSHSWVLDQHIFFRGLCRVYTLF